MSSRMDIRTGFRCNNNCLFCIYAVKTMNQSFSEICRSIDESVSLGINKLCITGGEPTIRRDLFKIMKYARDKGIDDFVLQTNARLFAYKKFVDKVVKSGINSFLVSLHGHNSKIHDRITRVDGSFAQAIKGVENLRSNKKMIIMINTTICALNYKYLSKITQLCLDLGVDHHQFTFVNLSGNGAINKKILAVKMSLAASHLKRCFDLHGSKIRIVCEGFPFCMLVGYEDLIEEQRLPLMKIRSPKDNYDYDHDHRKTHKLKSDACKLCIYDSNCEGIRPSYVSLFGFDELKPVKR